MATSNLELCLSTELSKKPSLEPLDDTAITASQQQDLNDHKVESCYYLKTNYEGLTIRSKQEWKMNYI